MKNIKIVIQYEGTNYCGWQRQNIGKTVQGEIEKAICLLTNEKIDLIGCSRTDAGVHALGMVANFRTKSTIPPDKFKNAINSKLPEDIAIISSQEVSLEYHSRYDSKGKTYSYTIINRDEKVILGRNYSYQVKGTLDILEMRKACSYFIGKHDFIAFRTLGSTAKTTVRTISELYIVKQGETIIVYISADGFLYNMVRIIIGTLLKVGKGKIKASDIPRIINEGKRENAGQCAPAKGLRLEKVYY